MRCRETGRDVVGIIHDRPELPEPSSSSLVLIQNIILMGRRTCAIHAIQVSPGIPRMSRKMFAALQNCALTPRGGETFTHRIYRVTYRVNEEFVCFPTVQEEVPGRFGESARSSMRVRLWSNEFETASLGSTRSMRRVIQLSETEKWNAVCDIKHEE